MEWLLVLAMTTAPDGYYVKGFVSERACTAEMNGIIKSIEQGGFENVKGIACVPVKEDI